MVALRNLAAEGQIVVWSKPQADSVFRAMDDWFDQSRVNLHAAIQEQVPGLLTEQQKERFVAAYMQVKSTGIPPKRTLPGYFDDWRSIVHELQEQSDRGVAIVGMALADARIQRALLASFLPRLSKAKQKDLFKGGPLGSSSAKIKIAHALGLLGPRSISDLDIIRGIRNDFAHKLEITSFRQEPIADRCGRLNLADIVFLGEIPPSDPRDRFVTSIINVMRFLYSEVVAGSKLAESPIKSR